MFGGQGRFVSFEDDFSAVPYLLLWKNDTQVCLNCLLSCDLVVLFITISPPFKAGWAIRIEGVGKAEEKNRRRLRKFCIIL